MKRPFLPVISSFILAGLILVPATAAQEGHEVVTGRLNDRDSEAIVEVELEAGQSIFILAERTEGELDLVLTLRDEDGDDVADNDDYSDYTLDSSISYTAENAGTYEIILERYDDEGRGEFRLTYDIGNDAVFAPVKYLDRLLLSGPMAYRDTSHFRIHYTLEGEDAVTENYLNGVALTVEEVYRIQIERLQWPLPPGDDGGGGNDLYDIYLLDVIGETGHAFGYVTFYEDVGDNPNTAGEEDNAASSFMVLDNDYDLEEDDPILATSLMRATMSHEYNHAIQYGYTAGSDRGLRWYYEATATWMETVALSKDQDATGYVETVFTYPELCFGYGGDDDNEVDLVYGEWLFIESIAEDHGDEIVQQLWTNLIDDSGFTALVRTLEARGDTLENAMIRYYVKNLTLSYELADLFDATVWLEDRIEDLGTWEPRGDGLQELSANYFEVRLPDDIYYARILGDESALQLWGVGVTDEQADVFSLDGGANFDPSAYERFYLFVFNPIYDDNVDRCRFYNYEISIEEAKTGDPAEVVFSLDAPRFRPPIMQ